MFDAVFLGKLRKFMTAILRPIVANELVHDAMSGNVLFNMSNDVARSSVPLKVIKVNSM